MLGRIVFGAGMLAAGLLASAATASQTANYTYDVHGRLIGVSRVGGANTTYAYDAGDSRTSKVTTGALSLLAADAGPDSGPDSEAAVSEADDEDDAAEEAAPES